MSSLPNTSVNKLIQWILSFQLTWGDFAFAGVFDYLKTMLQIPDLEEKYPAFKKVINAVYSIPKVKAYADKAPASVSGF